MTLIDKIAWIRRPDGGIPKHSGAHVTQPDSRGYRVRDATVRSTYWLWIF
jgi:hypothetical protein